MNETQVEDVQALVQDALEASTLGDREAAKELLEEASTLISAMIGKL
jgi:hypothetical protein